MSASVEKVGGDGDDAFVGRGNIPDRMARRTTGVTQPLAPADTGHPRNYVSCLGWLKS
ncbi:hypothetical protein GCM10027355_36800 [Haloplanus salinarum]